MKKYKDLNDFNKNRELKWKTGDAGKGPYDLGRTDWNKYRNSKLWDTIGPDRREPSGKNK